MKFTQTRLRTRVLSGVLSAFIATSMAVTPVLSQMPGIGNGIAITASAENGDSTAVTPAESGTPLWTGSALKLADVTVKSGEKIRYIVSTDSTAPSAAELAADTNLNTVEATGEIKETTVGNAGTAYYIHYEKYTGGAWANSVTTEGPITITAPDFNDASFTISAGSPIDSTEENKSKFYYGDSVPLPVSIVSAADTNETNYIAGYTIKLKKSSNGTSGWAVAQNDSSQDIEFDSTANPYTLPALEPGYYKWSAAHGSNLGSNTDVDSAVFQVLAKPIANADKTTLADGINIYDLVAENSPALALNSVIELPYTPTWAAAGTGGGTADDVVDAVLASVASKFQIELGGTEKDEGTALLYDQDYEIVLDSSDDTDDLGAGPEVSDTRTYKVNIKGKGNYSGTLKGLSFKIVQGASNTVALTDPTTNKYDGSAASLDAILAEIKAGTITIDGVNATIDEDIAIAWKTDDEDAVDISFDTSSKKWKGKVVLSTGTNGLYSFSADPVTVNINGAKAAVAFNVTSADSGTAAAPTGLSASDQVYGEEYVPGSGTNVTLTDKILDGWQIQGASPAVTFGLDVDIYGSDAFWTYAKANAYSVTLEPVWEDAVTVTLDKGLSGASDGTITSIKIKKGGTLSTEDMKDGGTYKGPKYPGREILGWYTTNPHEDENAVKFVFSDKADSTNRATQINSSMTLYPKWATKNWTVNILNNKGDTTPLTTQTVIDGEYATTPTGVTPTRSYYKLSSQNWLNAADDKAWNFSTAVNDDLYLYPDWTSCEITFVPDKATANLGSGVNTSVTRDVTTYLDGSDEPNGPIVPPTFTAGDTGFLGWYDNDGNLYDLSVIPTEDLTLTAKWGSVVASATGTPEDVSGVKVEDNAAFDTITYSDATSPVVADSATEASIESSFNTVLNRTEVEEDVDYQFVADSGSIVRAKFDIDLEKNSASGTPVTEVTGGVWVEVTLANGITLSSAPAKKQQVAVMHLGATNNLIFGDDVDYTSGSTTLKFKSDKFSTFAVVVIEVKDETPTTGDDDFTGKITWVVDGHETSQTYNHGQIPTYNNGVNPTKEGYIFKGWSPEAPHAVSGDFTYTAVFEPDPDYVVTTTTTEQGGETTETTTTTVVGSVAAPTNVKVADDGTVSWDASANASYYIVAKVVDGKTSKGSKVTTTSYKFKNVPTSDYVVYVTAYGEDGKTAESEKLTVKYFKAPTNVKVDSTGKVTWTANGGVAFRVVKVVNGVTYYGKKTTDKSYKVAPAKGAYTISVKAYDEDGNILESTPVVVNAKNELGVPSNVKVSADGTVTWTAAKNAVEYKVAKIGDKTYYSSKITGTSYKFASDPRTAYTVKVVAFDADGNKSWSSECKVPAKTLGVVSNPKVDAKGVVTWDAAENAVSYKVGKIVGSKTYYTKEVKTTSVKFSNLPKTYKLFVVAKDKYGVETVGPQVKITDMASATNVELSADKKTVSWTAAEGAAKYQVVKFVNGKRYYTAKTTDTSISFKNAASKNTMIYVIAFDETGKNTSYSEVITVK